MGDLRWPANTPVDSILEELAQRIDALEERANQRALILDEIDGKLTSLLVQVAELARDNGEIQ